MDKAQVESLAEAKDCCENCLFCWLYEEQYGFWQCRYNPPVRVITNSMRPDILGSYPAVRPHWWCGRYQPTEEKKSAEWRKMCDEINKEVFGDKEEEDNL